MCIHVVCTCRFVQVLARRLPEVKDFITLFGGKMQINLHLICVKS